MASANRRISIGLKLAFAATLGLSIASTALSLSKLVQGQDSLDDLVLRSNAKIKQYKDMQDTVQAVSGTLRTLALIEDLEARARETGALHTLNAQYDKLWLDLQKTPTSDRGRAVRADIQQAASAARALNAKVLELELAGYSPQARTLLLREAAPAAQKWLDSLDDYIVLQEKRNQQDVQAARSSYQTTRTLQLAISAGSAALAIMLAWFISRGTLRALGGGTVGQPVELTARARALSNNRRRDQR
jgi:methyl-accepting chemotaxis protein